MNVIKSMFILAIVCLLSIFNGCGNVRFQSKVKPEDEIISLDKPGEAPKGKNQDYKIGDQVSVVENTGGFSVNGQVDEVCDKLVFTKNAYNLGGGKVWLPLEKIPAHVPSQNDRDVEKIVPKGYRIKLGDVRSRYEWFPPEQLFPAPWANNVNLKIGDIVYGKSYGNYDKGKGVVTELPATGYDKFRVRFGESRESSEVSTSEIFASSYQAKPEDLMPGNIVYYDKSYWAIVIGKRDNKIIIRENGFGANDIMVDVSKLQILK